MTGGQGVAGSNPAVPTGQRIISNTNSTVQEYGVAYDTAQHAVMTLQAEGLVVRYPGRGYYVTGRD